jgi:hypothetical protein
MMTAKWHGELAWCARPGCNYPRALGKAGSDAGGPDIRLRGHRWRRDGSAGDLERYVCVERLGRIVTTSRAGRTRRTRNLDIRARLPIQARCACGAEQVIPIPYESQSRP